MGSYLAKNGQDGLVFRNTATQNTPLRYCLSISLWVGHSTLRDRHNSEDAPYFLMSRASLRVGESTLSDDACNRLAASMKQIGLRNPISVRIVDDYVDEDGQVCDGVPILVAGRHRLEAAKRLGWSHIDCVEVEDDEIQAELWEIAENLHRLDLTKEQRDEHIRRYAVLLEARGQVRQNVAPVLSDGRKSAPQHGKAIPRQIAEETGVSVRTVQRILNNTVPIKAAKEPESEAEAIIREANAIVSAWNRARQRAANPSPQTAAMEITTLIISSCCNLRADLKFQSRLCYLEPTQPEHSIFPSDTGGEAHRARCRMNQAAPIWQSVALPCRRKQELLPIQRSATS